MMSLKLMYITNNPDVGRIAEGCGVDRIFVDMEHLRKNVRQNGRDSVQNHHTPSDIRALKDALTTAEVLVRVNSIHEAYGDVPSSKQEIDKVIQAGADVVMLPYFKTVREAQEFLAYVDGRARTSLLVETAESVQKLDRILDLPGVDEIYIGLNDLSISYDMTFMFEPMTDGTVERICHATRMAGLPYGIGGIASLGKGMVPAELIIKEHYRLGSSMAILSRSFCNVNQCDDLKEIEKKFSDGMRAIRDFERECEQHAAFFWDNELQLRKSVAAVVAQMQV